jgi:CspA family cold shock protein
MENGQIKKKIDDRHFGFIRTGDGREVFFHGSALIETSWDDLNPDDEVTFEIEESPKGPRAINVKRAE